MRTRLWHLLGVGRFSPVIRRTPALANYLSLDLAARARDTVGRTGGRLVARAASFLLLADSRASFQIEGERPPRNRLERWGRAVLQAGKNPLTLDEIIRLHNVLIEDTRFVRLGLRTEGVFLGERDHFGDPLPEFVGARQWRPTPERNVEVLNDTADFYRYFDGTAAAEFLYACVQRTVDEDLPREIDYLRRHDEAVQRVMETVEMPDRIAENLVMFIRQNGGTLSTKRRQGEFAQLTDDEVQRIERIVADAFVGFADARGTLREPATDA